jgi:glycosyltransferase involved in cell wall biosynthesis
MAYIFKKYNEGDILYSIITPVYNQESIICKNLKSVIDCTIGTFEIILILDYCFDDTEKNILKFLDTYENTNRYFIQIKIFKNTEKPLFETKCDNIGFRNAVGHYCLEIQADMMMSEVGYNLHLLKPFLQFPRILAVSGRCAHGLFNHSVGIGKMGYDVEKTIEELGVDQNRFYVVETCNRGPLLLDRKKLMELNYLNEEEYFLDNSDHDLMARAYLEKNYICGYVPINFKSPLTDGSTRNNKSYEHCKEWSVNKAEKERLTAEMKVKPGLSKFYAVWKSRTPVVYIL